MTTAPAARPAPTAAGYAAREVTQPPNWHGLVALDFVLNALTAGLFLVAAVGLLARPTAFRPVVAWAFPLALAVLLATLFCLVWDLGHKTRFHHMLRLVNLRSPMSVGTWFLTGYSFPLAGAAVVEVFGLLGWLPADAGWVAVVRTVLVVAAVPFALGAGGYKGILYSATAQPGWRDARWLGAYHTLSFLAIGAGVLWAGAELAGHEPAAGLLRPAAGALAALAAVPTVMLAVELWPTLVRAYSAGERKGLATAAAVGVVLPVGLAVVGGTGAAVGAAAAGLAAGATVRAAVVYLPHRVHARTWRPGG